MVPLKVVEQQLHGEGVEEVIPDSRKLRHNRIISIYTFRGIYCNPCNFKEGFVAYLFPDSYLSGILNSKLSPSGKTISYLSFVSRFGENQNPRKGLFEVGTGFENRLLQAYTSGNVHQQGHTGDEGTYSSLPQRLCQRVGE